MTKPWSLGTAIAHVDLRSRDVDIDNLTFKLDLDRIWLRYGADTFQAPMPAAEGTVTFDEYLKQKQPAEAS